MLLPINPATPRAEVLKNLNTELIYFLEQAQTTTLFNRTLFSQTAIGQACFDNEATQAKFEDFFDQSTQNERTRLYDFIQQNQDLENFWSHYQPHPQISDQANKALKRLTAHLYSNTKDLKPVIHASQKQDLNQHFELYKKLNTNLCIFCGMEELAATQDDSQTQWRSDYDHLLSKSEYPLFAAHPDNLLPMGTTCNQKAKQSKDILNHGSTQAFYPYTEYAARLLDLKFEHQDIDPEPLKLKLDFKNTTPTDQIKCENWNSIFQIESRLKGRFKNFEDNLSTLIDLDATYEPNKFRKRLQEAQQRYRNRHKYFKEWAVWEYHILHLVFIQSDEFHAGLFDTLTERLKEAGSTIHNLFPNFEIPFNQHQPTPKPETTEAE